MCRVWEHADHVVSPSFKVRSPWDGGASVSAGLMWCAALQLTRVGSVNALDSAQPALCPLHTNSSTCGSHCRVGVVDSKRSTCGSQCCTVVTTGANVGSRM